MTGTAQSIARLAAAAIAPWLLGACASFTPPPGGTWAASPAESGALAAHAQRIETTLAPGESAHWLLDDNADALRMRIALAELAVETLDIQYFIWQQDATGALLLEHVLAAADRGVRVRFLLDDLATAGLDDALAGLEAHPRIEVRVFNPWRSRRQLGRAFEFVFRAGQLNHRMHNKVFIADGRFAILGGRNIGDRYFGVYEDFVQHDADLMVGGAMLEGVIESFDAYWNAELSYGWLDVERPMDKLAALRRVCAQSRLANESRLAAFAPPEGGWERYLDAAAARAARGPGELFLDGPDVRAARPTQLYERFKKLMARAERELVLSSPYLVPDREFIDMLRELTGRGVRVRILTNSLASNNHVIAHSAYKKWRRALLETGAELYEMRADAQVLELYRTPPVEPGALALHTKAAVVDRRWAFVGSANIDPRSMIWNTEIGVVADAPELAGPLIRTLERDMRPENAWRVTLEDGGWLKWWNGDEALGRQPARGFQQRAVEFFMNLLPIKNQT